MRDNDISARGVEVTFANEKDYFTREPQKSILAPGGTPESPRSRPKPSSLAE